MNPAYPTPEELVDATWFKATASNGTEGRSRWST